MIIDSHCHLDYEPMYSNLDHIMSRALEKNIKYMLTISTTDSSYEKILRLVKKYENIYGTYGIHPHETSNCKNFSSEKIIDKINNHKKIIGIGETGLDFFYKNSNVISQRKIFIEHIHAAQLLNLPLIVHTREAENETYEILQKEKKNKEFKILIHCFTGSKNFAHKLIDLGSYISASGIVTFKKSYELAETFLSLPTDRILVETDSPYLSPEPLRGKSNEPSYITHTVEFLSKLKRIDYETFSKITSKNFSNLFGKLK